jgi:hypothetical protein
MSLLDDLHGLDISNIAGARGSISAAVNTSDLQSLLTSGAASSAMGALGASLDSVTSSFANPEALLRPVLDAVSSVGVHFDAGHLPFGDLGKSVQQGLQIITQFASSVSGNPADFGKIFGTTLGDAMKVVGNQTSTIGNLFGQQAGSFSELVNISSGTSNDPAALAAIAIEVLLPLPHADLKAARDGLNQVLSASGKLQLPTGRNQGLLGALDAVTVAAESGDEAKLQAALHALADVRAHTLAVIRDDLSFAQQQLSQLHVDATLAPIAKFAGTVRYGLEGPIEFLLDIRAKLQEARGHVDNLDFDVVRKYMNAVLPMIEAQAVAAIEAPIDQALKKAQDFIQRIFRELPVRQYRNEITAFLHAAAQGIEDAHLDGPANAVRDALEMVTKALDAGALTAGIQQALQKIVQVVQQTIQPILDALNTISTEVNQLAGAAEGILGRLTDALDQFQKGIDQVSAAINGLGIDQAEQQIVQKLDNLRQQVQTLTSNVPLPEPLKPQVEQLASLLENIDFDQMLEPVRSAVAELKIPDDVAGVVTDGLGKAKDVIEHLIPQELIASIQAEVDQVLQALKGFHPESLLPDVSQYLNEAAEAIEKLDPRPIAEEIRGPFQAVLDAIDKVNPYTLLEPVIGIYDTVMGAIPAPDGQSLFTSVRGLFDAGADQATQAVSGQPASSSGAGAGASSTPASGGAGTGGGSSTDPGSSGSGQSLDTPPAFKDVHMGDSIRLLAFIPTKLHEVLSALEAGPAGTVMQEIDSLCAGLARQIRGLQAALYATASRLDSGVEDLLVSLGPPSLRANLAIQVHFGNSASLHASLATVSEAAPGSLRRDLAPLVAAMRSAAHGVAAAAGGNHASLLTRLADVLESSPLAGLTTDAQHLLDALDPEPIAADLDAFTDKMLHMLPQIATELVDDFTTFTNRLRAIINNFNPGAQAQRFLSLLDVLRDEINILDPRRLAAELAEIHKAIRDAVAAYDPRVFADEIAAVTNALGQQIRALNPQQLLGNLDFLAPIVARIEQANPATALAGVGQSLTDVGERLGKIKLDDLISSINTLGPELETAFEHLLTSVKQEIVALLDSLKFASGGASASVSASASVG